MIVPIKNERGKIKNGKFKNKYQL